VAVAAEVTFPVAVTLRVEVRVAVGAVFVAVAVGRVGVAVAVRTVRVGVGVRVRVADCSGACVSVGVDGVYVLEDVRVAVAATVIWFVADVVGVAVRNGDEVAVRVRVAVKLRAGVRVDVAVSVGSAVDVGLSVGPGVKPWVGVEVGRTVRVIVDVSAMVGVRVGLAETVAVGGAGRVWVRVADGSGVGGFPIRTIILAGAPRLPCRSRICTVTMVSPCGNALVAFMTRQNCTRRKSVETKLGAPNASTVHALPRVSLKLKPQLSALRVLTISGWSSKVAG